MLLLTSGCDLRSLLRCFIGRVFIGSRTFRRNPMTDEEGKPVLLISSILVDAGQLGAGVINFESANEEADKILAEAGAVAEQKMRDKFPDLPNTVPTGTESAGFS